MIESWGCYGDRIRLIKRDEIVKEFNDIMLRVEFKDRRKLLEDPVTVIRIINEEREYHNIKYYPMNTETNKLCEELLVKKYHENVKTPIRTDLFRSNSIEQTIMEIDYAMLMME
jgi:hypothetical protein